MRPGLVYFSLLHKKGMLDISFYFNKVQFLSKSRKGNNLKLIDSYLALNVSIFDLILAQLKWNKQILTFFRKHHSSKAEKAPCLSIISMMLAAETLLLLAFGVLWHSSSKQNLKIIAVARITRTQCLLNRFGSHLLFVKILSESEQCL